MAECYACARAKSLDPKGEMDGGTMYLRGFLHGLYLSTTTNAEGVVDKLLHGGILCDMHLERCAAVVAIMSVISKSGTPE